jgi:hypothetical protein
MAIAGPGATYLESATARVVDSFSLSRGFLCEAVMQPSECPKFQTCNAPCCPLDPGHLKTVHLQGEPICRYLLASGKDGAAAYYQNDPTFEACLVQLEPVRQRFADIDRRVTIASRSGFRGAHLRGSHGVQGVS